MSNKVDRPLNNSFVSYFFQTEFIHFNLSVNAYSVTSVQWNDQRNSLATFLIKSRLSIVSSVLTGRQAFSISSLIFGGRGTGPSTIWVKSHEMDSLLKFIFSDPNGLLTSMLFHLSSELIYADL